MNSRATGLSVRWAGTRAANSNSMRGSNGRTAMPRGAYSVAVNGSHSVTPAPAPAIAQAISDSGVSMRFVRFYDGTTDAFKARFDVLFGMKVVRPEWIVRICSGAA